MVMPLSQGDEASPYLRGRVRRKRVMTPLRTEEESDVRWKRLEDPMISSSLTSRHRWHGQGGESVIPPDDGCLNEELSIRQRS